MDFVTSIGAWIIANGGEMTVALLGLVTFASFIANFTKTDADNKAVAWASKAVNWFALNFVNKPKPPAA